MEPLGAGASTEGPKTRRCEYVLKRFSFQNLLPVRCSKLSVITCTVDTREPIKIVRMYVNAA